MSQFQFPESSCCQLREKSDGTWLITPSVVKRQNSPGKNGHLTNQHLATQHWRDGRETKELPQRGQCNICTVFTIDKLNFRVVYRNIHASVWQDPGFLLFVYFGGESPALITCVFDGRSAPSVPMSIMVIARARTFWIATFIDIWEHESDHGRWKILQSVFF